MALCKTQIKGNVVAWEKSSMLRHNVTVDDIKNVSYFCYTRSKYVIFTEKVRFSEGETLCKIHGGDLAVPKSDQESKAILGIVSKHK